MEKQEFEKYPKLTEYIQRMATAGTIGDIYQWSEFLGELNRVLAASACAKIGEDIAVEFGEWCAKNYGYTQLGNLWIKRDDQNNISGKWVTTSELFQLFIEHKNK